MGYTIHDRSSSPNYFSDLCPWLPLVCIPLQGPATCAPGSQPLHFFFTRSFHTSYDLLTSFRYLLQGHLLSEIFPDCSIQCCNILNPPFYFFYHLPYYMFLFIVYCLFLQGCKLHLRRFFIWFSSLLLPTPSTGSVLWHVLDKYLQNECIHICLSKY